eukprot:COSAG02_NODE_7211_length_3117_cov_5.268390_1_plen_210_part_00
MHLLGSTEVNHHPEVLEVCVPHLPASRRQLGVVNERSRNGGRNANARARRIPLELPLRLGYRHDRRLPQPAECVIVELALRQCGRAAGRHSQVSLQARRLVERGDRAGELVAEVMLVPRLALQAVEATGLRVRRIVILDRPVRRALKVLQRFLRPTRTGEVELPSTTRKQLPDSLAREGERCEWVMSRSWYVAAVCRDDHRSRHRRTQR